MKTLVKWTERDHSDADRCDQCNVAFRRGERRLIGAAIRESGELDIQHPFIIYQGCQEPRQREKRYTEAVQTDLKTLG
jgi:hypothetical protein